MTDQERKATQVLLDLEAKVLDIHRQVGLNAALQKMMLDRLNRVYNYIALLEAEQSITAGTPSVIPQPESLIAPEPDQKEEPKTIDELPLGTRRTSRVENKLTEEKKQEMLAVPMSDRKVPVVQRITDRTGKDLFMAKVSVMNEDQQLILETKTNASGKWQAHLIPGTYIVHILKTDTATKQKIEGKQKITVGQTNGVFNLPVAIIKE